MIYTYVCTFHAEFKQATHDTTTTTTTPRRNCKVRVRVRASDFIGVSVCERLLGLFYALICHEPNLFAERH